MAGAAIFLLLALAYGFAVLCEEKAIDATHAKFQGFLQRRSGHLRVLSFKKS
jgi:hypothetical protein